MIPIQVTGDVNSGSYCLCIRSKSIQSITINHPTPCFRFRYHNIINSSHNVNHMYQATVLRMDHPIARIHPAMVRHVCVWSQLLHKMWCRNTVDSKMSMCISNVPVQVAGFIHDCSSCSCLRRYSIQSSTLNPPTLDAKAQIRGQDNPPKTCIPCEVQTSSC